MRSVPFLRESWFSPPDWKSQSATKSAESPSSCCSRLSLDIQREAPSRGHGGRLRRSSEMSGIWGRGRLCSRASAERKDNDVARHNDVVRQLVGNYTDLGLLKRIFCNSRVLTQIPQPNTLTFQIQFKNFLDHSSETGLKKNNCKY